MGVPPRRLSFVTFLYSFQRIIYKYVPNRITPTAPISIRRILTLWKHIDNI